METRELCKNIEGDPAKPGLAATTCWVGAGDDYATRPRAPHSIAAKAQSPVTTAKMRFQGSTLRNVKARNSSITGRTTHMMVDHGWLKGQPASRPFMMLSTAITPLPTAQISTKYAASRSCFSTLGAFSVLVFVISVHPMVGVAVTAHTGD